MPELPEVENIVQGLNKWVVHQPIIAVESDHLKSFPLSAEEVQLHLLDHFIQRVSRRGKAIQFELDHGMWLLCHLKMTGQLIYTNPMLRDSLDQDLPNKATRVIFTFSNRSHLYFNDVRKFGYIHLLSHAELQEVPLLKQMGPEPLDPNYRVKDLQDSLQKRKRTSIKQALLDQKVVAGLGNIYCDESLFLAGILPTRMVGSLKKKEIQNLYTSIRQVLTLAIELGGSSRANYRNAVGQKGFYLDQAKVYARKGQACRICQGPIEKIKLAGRGTHFCPHCQT